MSHETRRKTPDELLRELQVEETTSRGRLKIFLGYASGVGKSFRMLDEAHRRRERGQDVIVGAVQPKASPEVQKLLDKLEVVPLRKHASGSAMDLEAILRRLPAVCVIDGLAFNNPPGFRNSTRWQDARELVNAGIKVSGSINILCRRAERTSRSTDRETCDRNRADVFHNKRRRNRFVMPLLKNRSTGRPSRNLMRKEGRHGTQRCAK